MQYLTEDDVKAFYAEAIGKPILRYSDGLASAVARPRQSAFGKDAYATIALKAAALMQSLAQNQPFVDGNKRIAWISLIGSIATFRPNRRVRLERTIRSSSRHSSR